MKTTPRRLKNSTTGTVLFLDFETGAKTDIKTRGAWNYSQDAHILLISYRFSNWKPGRVEFVTNWERNKLTKNDLPKELISHKGPIVAHNWFFEYAIFTHCLPFLKLAPDIFRCTAATSRRMGLPGDLFGACKALKLPFQKDKTEGDKLIKLYSIPDRNGNFRLIPPVDRQKWLSYGKGDILSMESLYDALPRLHEDKFEWPVFQFDKTVNVRGLHIDRKNTQKIKNLYESAVTITEEKAKKLCGVEKSGTLTVSSPVGFVRWVNTQGTGVKIIVPKEDGKHVTRPYVLENAQAYTLDTLYNRTKTAKIKEAIDYRRTLAASAPKKLDAFLNLSDDAADVRGAFLYFGAHTGRWAGRGLQPHNLPRDAAKDWAKTLKEIATEVKNKKVLKTVEKINSLIRGLITPRKGSFVVSDFAAIEARALFFLSGCERGLQIYRDGKNPYLELGAEMFGRKITKDETREYTLAKNAVLGLGYGMGKDRFFEYCKLTGEEITADFAERTVKIYRGTFPEVPAFWRMSENAMREAIRDGESEQGYKSTSVAWRRSKDKSFLRAVLPNGRAMYYFKPRATAEGLQCVQAHGGLQKLWGGLIAENIVQGYCRDLLAHCGQVAIGGGFDVVGHVHDELIIETLKPEKDLKAIEKIMSTPPAWAPGFPLKCEAKTMERYGK